MLSAVTSGLLPVSGSLLFVSAHVDSPPRIRLPETATRSNTQSLSLRPAGTGSLSLCLGQPQLFVVQSQQRRHGLQRSQRQSSSGSWSCQRCVRRRSSHLLRLLVLNVRQQSGWEERRRRLSPPRRHPAPDTARLPACITSLIVAGQRGERSTQSAQPSAAGSPDWAEAQWLDSVPWTLPR